LRRALGHEGSRQEPSRFDLCGSRHAVRRNGDGGGRTAHTRFAGERGEDGARGVTSINQSCGDIREESGATAADIAGEMNGHNRGPGWTKA